MALDIRMTTNIGYQSRHVYRVSKVKSLQCGTEITTYNVQKTGKLKTDENQQRAGNSHRLVSIGI